jgi:hypothetical protein
MKWRVFSVVVALGASVACGPRTEGLDRSTLPENIRADYDLFARKCSKCHSLARPLQSGITDDEQWVMYVTRMRRQPASGITLEDQEVILRFLRYYAAEQRRAKAEKAGVVPAPPPSSTPAPAPSAAEGGAP